MDAGELLLFACMLFADNDLKHTIVSSSKFVSLKHISQTSLSYLDPMLYT